MLANNSRLSFFFHTIYYTVFFIYQGGAGTAKTSVCFDSAILSNVLTIINNYSSLNIGNLTFSAL